MKLDDNIKRIFDFDMLFLLADHNLSAYSIGVFRQWVVRSKLQTSCRMSETIIQIAIFELEP